MMCLCSSIGDDLDLTVQRMTIPPNTGGPFVFNISVASHGDRLEVNEVFLLYLNITAGNLFPTRECAVGRILAPTSSVVG